MALTANKNYLSSESFRLVISRTDYPNLEYFCNSAMHPDVSVGESTTPNARLDHFSPGDKMTMGTLTCSIILDEDMESYKEVFKWCENIVNGKTNDTADLALQILSSKNNVLNTINYIDAFPTNVSNLQFTTNTNEYITFDVTFRMRYFTI
jgi:hypothetical protein